ncbi:MAG: NAD-dependent epimerase/dehydratase family protein [Desulfovibrio sp.]|jgi:nucleoside-diphosphate-sugar epimerase|nr:NAD-dependent epimerase/dehydratase family protein [Desulfovibrio sp.]
MKRHAFIIGGTGQIGYATALELINSGWRVTISCRRKTKIALNLIGKGVAMIQLDRNEPNALSKALGEGIDALIDTAAFDSLHAEQLLSLQDKIGALVVISSSSVYRDNAGRTLDEAGENGFPNFPEPIKETQFLVEPGPKTYSTRKALLECRLLVNPRIPIIILRPGAIHGIYSTHAREWWFVKRIIDKRSIIPLAYGGRSRFHTCSSLNIARLITFALANPKTGIFNVADPQALTVIQIGQAIALHMNYKGNLIPLEIGDAYGKSPVGWSPWSVAGPFVLDTSKAQKEFGNILTTQYEDTVDEICNWLVSESHEDWHINFPVLASYPMNLFDYTAEDQFFVRKKE